MKKFKAIVDFYKSPALMTGLSMCSRQLLKKEVGSNMECAYGMFHTMFVGCLGHCVERLVSARISGDENCFFARTSSTPFPAMHSGMPMKSVLFLE